MESTVQPISREQLLERRQRPDSLTSPITISLPGR
jgi:hypothetical protein